jgi:nitroreductase
MDVMEAIRWRRSVRRFSGRKIEWGDMMLILEAGRLAPSSSNAQGWHFVVVDDDKLIQAIPGMAPLGVDRITAFARGASAIIVGCYTKKLTHAIAEVFRHENHLIDVSIAMTQMTLAATSLGIGSCWIGWFSDKKLRKMLGIPDRYRIACLIALGYPEQASTARGIGGIEPRPRKDMKNIVSINQFGNPPASRGPGKKNPS